MGPLWHVLLLSPSLRPTVDITVTVDTDTVDTTEERGPLTPNPRLKLLPLLHPKLKLRLNPITDTTDTDTTPVLTDTADTDTVISAKDLLMLNPKLKLKLNPTTDTDTVDTMAVPTDITDTVILAKGPLKPNLSLTTDTMAVDTMVDTVDIMAVDTTGVKWILLVKMLKKPLNYLQDQ